MLKGVSLLIMLSGTGLLLLSCIGLVRPQTVSIADRPHGAPAHYYQSTITYEDALNRVDSLRGMSRSHDEKARALFELVRDAYVHDPQSGYLVTPWDNWYLWLKGQFDARSLQSQDFFFLLKRGAGFCDQAAMIYAGLAQEIGLEARLIWLSGHVVSEVKLGSDWVVVDPDLGIFWNAPLENFGRELSAAAVQAAIMAEGFDSTLSTTISEAYVSQENNRRSAYPYLPRLYQEEKRAEVVKWFVPLVITCVGFLLFLRAIAA